MVAAFSGEGSNATGLGSLRERMERGEFDLIAVGRALISDPTWVTKIKNGWLDQLKDFLPSSLAELV